VARSSTEDPAAMTAERALFKYSILYLFALFAALVVDAWLA
jgi:protoheme IX farnesyltransferase